MAVPLPICLQRRRRHVPSRKAVLEKTAQFLARPKRLDTGRALQTKTSVPNARVGSKSEVFLPARHFRCTLKSGRRQAQAEVHSIAHVSSHPYPAQIAKMPWPAPEPARA